MKRAWFAAVLLLVLLLVSPQAGATVTGDCEVIIHGVDVRDRSTDDPSDAIQVHVGEQVDYTITVVGMARTFRLYVEVGPYEFIVDEQNFTASQGVQVIGGNTTLEGLRGGAAGVYRYRGVVTQWEDPTCTGAVLIHIVPTSPFTPVLIGATLVAAGALSSLIVLAVRSFQSVKEIVDVVKDFIQQARHLAKAK